MPQQHNPGRHVQSLTLPQSRHNHRNTSAYIFPTVPTPRTTPPTPGTASPRRRAPTLQLPVATRPLHSRHSPAAEHRPHTVPTPRPPTDTGPRLAAGHCPASPPGPNAPTPRRNAPAPFKTLPCRRTPTPHRPDTSAPRRHRATPRRRALPRLSAGPQCSNSPSQRSRPIQGTPLPPHNGSTVPTPRTIPPTPEPATRRALPHLTAGTQRSNSPSQRSRSIQDTPLPPHNGPTPSQPSDHPAGAGFNRTAGHKKIRLCEPDLFICQ